VVDIIKKASMFVPVITILAFVTIIMAILILHSLKAQLGPEIGERQF
jgi:hypothetical protein